VPLWCLAVPVASDPPPILACCRTQCFPRLEEQSAGKLVDKYVELRDKVWPAAGVTAVSLLKSYPVDTAVDTAAACVLIHQQPAAGAVFAFTKCC